MHESKRERYIRILSGLGGADISAEACKEIVALLKEAPERKKGKWIGISPFVDTLMCSECGENIIGEEFKSNYCPHCGADMRGES